jgi:hypothetical protein
MRLRALWQVLARAALRMSPFSHETGPRMHIADDPEDPAVARLKTVLHEDFHARRVRSLGAGGLQNVQWHRYQSDVGSLTLQFETYIGVDLFGPREGLDRVAARLWAETPIGDPTAGDGA